MTGPEFDELAARCSYCRVPPGQWCMTWDLRLARRTHAPRRRLSLAVAAHADPALDEMWPHHGPCGICGTPGLGARHRVIDAIAGWLEGAAADPEDAELLDEEPAAFDEELAAEFGVTVEAVAVVRAWAQKWPGAW